MSTVEQMQPLYIAIFVLIISIFIGQVTSQFKEKFINSSRAQYAPYQQSAMYSKEYMKKLDDMTRDAYKNIFTNKIPTYLDHPCHPACCNKSTSLSCSHGCVCMTNEDLKMFDNH